MSTRPWINLFQNAGGGNGSLLDLNLVGGMKIYRLARVLLQRVVSFDYIFLILDR